MKFRTNAASLFFALLSALPGCAWAQSYCRPSDSLGAEFRSHIALYSSATGPGDDRIVRDSLRLGAASASSVVLLAEQTVCKKANTAYQAAVTDPRGSGFSGKVYVVKAGTTYAVFDPDYHIDGRTDKWVIVIVDSRYKVLSLF